MLQPDDFYLDAHRTLYATVLRLHELGAGVDRLTVADALRAAGDDQLAGTPVDVYLALLHEHAAIAVHLDDYVKIVARESAKRQEIAVLERAMARAFDGGDPATLAAETGEALAKIVERAEPVHHPAGPVPIADVLATLVGSLDTPETDFVRCPVEEVNERLAGGVLRGELVYLGGRPGVAKTALAIQWAVLAAECGHRTLVVSREMKNTALARRLLAQQTQVSASALRKRDLAPDELRRVERALPRLGALPLWFDDRSRTLAQIRRAVRSGAYRFVVVDYVQLVRSPQDAASKRLEVSAVSAGLKEIAERADCSVLALSSMSRLEKDRGKRVPPALDNLKESGDLEHDGDVVLLLHQPKADSSDRELVFAKIRDGAGGGAVTLAFTPVYVRFTEVSREREPGEEEVPF